MDKNINLLQLLENCAEKMKIQDEQERAKDPVAYSKKWRKYFEEEAILMQERSKEHKEFACFGTFGRGDRCRGAG